MVDDFDAREHFSMLKTVKAPLHKFELGVHVTCKPGPFAAKSFFE